MEDRANSSIACSVTTCAHHCKAQQYCSLNEVKIGCCDANATSCTSTECNSFKLN